MRSGEVSLSWRLAKGWSSRRAEQDIEGDEVAMGQLLPLALDVTREDILHEAAQTLASRLPAGENGK